MSSDPLQPTIQTPPEVEAAFEALLAWVEDQPDPVLVAQAWRAAWDLLNELEQSLKATRVGAVRLLKAEGWSLTEIGSTLKIDKSQVSRIVNGKR